jgi:hypothetical protein
LPSSFRPKPEGLLADVGRTGYLRGLHLSALLSAAGSLGLAAFTAYLFRNIRTPAEEAERAERAH